MSRKDKSIKKKINSYKALIKKSGFEGLERKDIEKVALFKALAENASEDLEFLDSALLSNLFGVKDFARFIKGELGSNAPENALQ